MKSLGTLIVVAALIASSSAMIASVGRGHDEGGTLVVRAAGSETDPVALIEPLPTVVENGTECLLDGRNSYDPSNDFTTNLSTIVNYTWIIRHDSETFSFTNSSRWFTFDDQGLYEITFIVRDSWGNEGYAFHALICVDDVDFDGLPDWWEEHYFFSMDEGPEDDFDSDGYTNLQEWALGTDPAVPEPTADDRSFLEKSWAYVVGAFVASFLVILVLVYPRLRRRRKELETRKIAYAIELEKSLHDDGSSQGEDEHRSP